MRKNPFRTISIAIGLAILCLCYVQASSGQTSALLRNLADNPTNAILGLPFQVTQNNLNASTNRFGEYLPVATLNGNGAWVDEVKVLGAFLDREANTTIPSSAALERIHFMMALGEQQLCTPANLKNPFSPLFVGRYACSTALKIVGTNHYTGINITETTFKAPGMFLEKGKTYGVAVFAVSRDASDPDTLWAVYAVNKTNVPADIIVMETKVIPMSAIQTQINKLVYTVTTTTNAPPLLAVPRLGITKGAGGVNLQVNALSVGQSYAVESTPRFTAPAVAWALKSNLPPSATVFSTPIVATGTEFFRIRQLNAWKR